MILILIGAQPPRQRTAEKQIHSRPVSTGRKRANESDRRKERDEENKRQLSENRTNG